MANEPLYTLHAGSQIFQGTANELDAVRATLKRDAHDHWGSWSGRKTPSKHYETAQETERKIA